MGVPKDIREALESEGLGAVELEYIDGQLYIDDMEVNTAYHAADREVAGRGFNGVQGLIMWTCYLAHQCAAQQLQTGDPSATYFINLVQETFAAAYMRVLDGAMSQTDPQKFN